MPSQRATTRTTSRTTPRGLGRSVRLFRDFLHEQDDPARFYTALAEDSVALIADRADLDGALVLDVSAGDVTQHQPGMLAVAAVGEQLPFRTGSFDVTFSSNVLEHVPDPRPFC